MWSIGMISRSHREGRRFDSVHPHSCFPEPNNNKEECEYTLKAMLKITELIIMLRIILCLVMLLFIFGCVKPEVADMVPKDSDEIKIIETTVGNICEKSIGVANIYKDKDDMLRVTLTVLEDNKQSRVSKGEIVSSSKGDILVKDIVEIPSKSSLPGSSASYVVLVCLPKSKPFDAPEGIDASEINKPVVWGEINETGGKLTTIKGKAEETKAGVYVDGVLVEIYGEKYMGKVIEVTGYVHENQCTDAGVSEGLGEDGLYVQCYDGPYMAKIKEIKIIE